MGQLVSLSRRRPLILLSVVWVMLRRQPETALLDGPVLLPGFVGRNPLGIVAATYLE